MSNKRIATLNHLKEIFGINYDKSETQWAADKGAIAIRKSDAEKTGTSMAKLNDAIGGVAGVAGVLSSIMPKSTLFRGASIALTAANLGTVSLRQSLNDKGIIPSTTTSAELQRRKSALQSVLIGQSYRAMQMGKHPTTDQNINPAWLYSGNPAGYALAALGGAKGWAGGAASALANITSTDAAAQTGDEISSKFGMPPMFPNSALLTQKAPYGTYSKYDLERNPGALELRAASYRSR